MSNTLKSTAESPSASLLEERINATRKEVKRVDLIVTIVTLLAALVVYFFVVVLLDHWVFRNGLSVQMRFLLFVLGLIGFVSFFVLRLIPIVKYAVNPVYAAQILEGHKPSLKNAIINWILLRREREEQPVAGKQPLQEKMFEGVTVKAARGVAELPQELTVDHSQVIRLGIVLTVVLVVFCLYTVFSPKSPLQSIYRLVFPLADIQAPQSIKFQDIQPGNATVFQGDRLTVKASLHGLGKNDEVFLYYSTKNERLIDQAVPMNIPEGSRIYECSFPPTNLGFEEDVTYYIGVAESRSRTFKVTVKPPITFEVKSVKYEYPEYTGLASVTVENSGDLRAIEGTKAIINASSNTPMKTAKLIPDSKEDEAKNMTVSSREPTSASVPFWMQFDQIRRGYQEYTTYSIRCYDEALNANKRPSVYNIEVIADRPPSIEWIDPNLETLELPINFNHEVKVFAEDPDFGIRYVLLHLETPEKTLSPIRLLNGPEFGAVKNTSPLELAGNIRPKDLGLVVGDRVEYWAEVIDSKLPEPNVASTNRLRFVVTQNQIDDERDPEAKKDDRQNNQNEQEKQNRKNEDNQQPQNEKQNEPGQSEEQNGTGEQNDPGGETPNGEQLGGSEETGGNEQQKRDEPIDGESNPGDVFQEAVDHIKEKEPELMDKLREEAEQEAREEQREKQQNQQQQGNGNDQQENQQQPGQQDEGNSGGENQQPQGGNGNEGVQQEGGPSGEGDQQQGGVNGEKGPQGGMNGGEDDGSNDGEQSGNSGGDRPAEFPDKEGAASRGGETRNGHQDDANPNAREGNDPQNAQNTGTEQPAQGANGNSREANEAPQNGNATPSDDNPDGTGKIPDGARGTETESNRDTPGNPSDRNADPDKSNNANRHQNGTPPDKLPESGGRAGENDDPNAQKAEQGKGGGEGNSNENVRSDPTRHDPQKGGDSGDHEGEGGTPKDSGNAEGTGSRPDPNGGQNDGNSVGNNKSEGGEPSTEQGDQPGGGADQQEVDSPANGGDQPTQGGGSEEQGNPDNQNSKGGKQSPNGGDGSPQNGSQMPGDQQAPEGTPGNSNQRSGPRPEGSDPTQSSMQQTFDTPPEDVDKKLSEKVTNLVLEELGKDNPDQQLLDRLGWTKEDANRFAQKWNEMSQLGTKAEPGSKDDTEWRETLDSLGIQTEKRNLRSARIDPKAQHKTAIESSRGTVPAIFKDRFNAYSSGSNE